MPSAASGSVTNSRYASSRITGTVAGTRSRNAVSSSRRSTEPVGLFGLQISTHRVLSVTAAAIASRSRP